MACFVASVTLLGKGGYESELRDFLARKFDLELGLHFAFGPVNATYSLTGHV